MKRKSNKKLTIALLALLGVVSAGGTYAYWQGTVQDAADAGKSNTITIGEGAAVETKIVFGTVASNSEKQLVPAGFAQKADEVESIAYSYEVSWAATDPVYAASVSGGTLSAVAVVDSATKGGVAVSADDLAVIKTLLTITTFADAAIELNDTTPVDVEFTFELTEPADADEYSAVAGAVITIAVTFSVVVA